MVMLHLQNWTLEPFTKFMGQFSGEKLGMEITGHYINKFSLSYSYHMLNGLLEIDESLVLGGIPNMLGYITFTFFK